MANSTKEVTKSVTKGRKPPAAGKGRPKGTLNKTTQAVKDMITAALDQVGGVDYLARQAAENPKAFLSLVGRVIPVQVTGEGGGALTVVVRDFTGRKQDVAD